MLYSSRGEKKIAIIIKQHPLTMKKLFPKLLLLVALFSLASCGSAPSKKKCGSDGVCRIGDEKYNPNRLWEMPSEK